MKEQDFCNSTGFTTDGFLDKNISLKDAIKTNSSEHYQVRSTDYIHSFKLAADLVVRNSSIKKDLTHGKYLSLHTALYLYNHYIELYLKYTFSILKKEHPKNTHNLKELWKPIHIYADRFLLLKDKETNRHLQQFINDFVEVEEKIGNQVDAFKYATTKRGNLLNNPIEEIDPVYLVTVMAQFDNTISCLIDTLTNGEG